MTATEPYGGSFAGLEARRASDPEPIRAHRRRALDRFQARGWPNAREEDWRNTNLSPIAGREFFPAPVSAVRAASDSVGPADAVFVDGRLAELRPGGPGGVSLQPLSEVLRTDPEKLAPYLARLASSSDPFVMLNDAFLEEGVVLEIAKDRVATAPIHLLYISTGGSDVFRSIRNVVLARESSRITLVETFAGNGAGPALTDAVTQVSVGENSAVEHLKIQREGAAAYHFGTLSAEQGRDSRFTSHLFSFGGAVARNSVHAALEAEGVECSLNGLFLGSDGQRVDNLTVIDHARPHGTSRELYKGILDGASRGAFTGRILVRPDAQKTDAQQASKNLILSRDALVNSTPQLEIRANDVKCKHGATTGQLDPDAIFYLRSRGISEEASRNLLTYAFAADVVQRISDPALRRPVEEILRSRLPFAPDGAELSAQPIPELS